MKKIIGLIGATTLIVGSCATAVSCANTKSGVSEKDKKEFIEFFEPLKEVKVKWRETIDESLNEFVKQQANTQKWKNHKFTKFKMIYIYKAYAILNKLKAGEAFITYDDHLNEDKVTIEGFIGVKKNNKVETKRIDAITLPFINEKNPITDISNNLNLIKLEIFENWEKNDVALKINEAMKKINYKLEEDKHYRIDFSQALNQEGKTIAGRQVLISAINNELIKGKFKITIRSMNI